MCNTNKYKKLLSNTLTFGIGTFSSKILVFLLMPLYTRALTPDEFGVVDLLVQTANLIVPVISAGIVSAVIRFGLDKAYDKSSVFTAGFITITVGFGVFLLAIPLMRLIDFVTEYTLLIYLFVLMSAFRSLCSHFVRSMQYVKLFSFDGVLSTVMVILFNVIFLLGFRMGITGYILATILSDFVSILFLTVVAELWKFLKWKGFEKSTFKKMLQYSVPLIPTSLFWWITNVSDRYMVNYMLGSDANGLYAVAYKIPTIVVLVSTIFTEAWQMSAVLENDADKKQFFSKVFSSYSSLMFLCTSVLILSCKLTTRLLVDMSYYSSWQYVPVLVLATAFSCFANFLGSVYMVEKKSMITLLTVLAGAASNIILNIFLIPAMGVNGAALATFMSYVIVFVVRAVTSRKFIKINMNVPRLLLNLLLTGAQAFIMISEIHLWVVWELALFAAVLLFNVRPLIRSVKKQFFAKS